MKLAKATAVCTTLAMVLLGHRAAEADPVTQQFNYEVSGDVGTRAGVPIGNISFEGAPFYTGNWGWMGAQFTAPGSFTLGEFQMAPLPDGSSLTYHNFPFYLQLDVAPVTKDAMLGGQVNIVGALDGTVTGSTGSTVVATITSMSATGNLPFPFQDLKIDVPQALNVGKPTVLTAQVVGLAPPVPEPSTLLIACLITAGPVLRSACRRARARSGGAQGKCDSSQI